MFVEESKMSDPETSTGKRARNVLTIETKLKIIDEIEKGATISSVSQKYNVPQTTVSDIKNRRNEIQNFASEMEEPDAKKRKTMKLPQNPVLDKCVYVWFAQKRSEGVPITGPLLCEKARFFSNALGDSDFGATDGWLRNFKQRHGIRQLSIEGEKNERSQLRNH